MSSYTFNGKSLNKTYRDSYSGFHGVAIGIVFYTTGCTQLLIQPKLGENGEFREPRWVDEARLIEIAGDPQISLDIDSSVSMRSDSIGSDVPPPVR